MPQRTALLLVLLSFTLGSLLHAACDPPNDFSLDPTVDFNCDGRTSVYCGVDFGAIDLYTNALVTGFMVTEHLTYVLVGGPGFDQPDGIVEDFFSLVDVAGADICLSGPNAGLPCDPGNGNADCPISFCGTADGTVSFDPSLVGQVITESGDYADPTACTGDLLCDVLFFVPGGNATGNTNGDATPVNPNCDRLSQDQAVACSLYFLDNTTLVIPALPAAAPVVTVARGDVLELDFGPGGVDLSPVGCLGESPAWTPVVDVQVPLIGDIFFYVARWDDGSNYPYGNSSPSCQDRFVPSDNGVCGEPCTNPGDCISGFCADGFCCDGLCEGECSACDVLGLEGTCANIPTGTDPDGECGAVSCTGYFWGWDGLDCHAVADAAGSCSGDGRCMSQEEECLGGAKGAVVLSCSPPCEAPESGTCSGTIPGSCEADPDCMFCVGGLFPGSICDIDADCGGTCSGGTVAPDGAPCFSALECGGVCVGGGFNGRPCSAGSSATFCVNFGGVCNLDGVECRLGQCVPSGS